MNAADIVIKNFDDHTNVIWLVTEFFSRVSCPHGQAKEPGVQAQIRGVPRCFTYVLRQTTGAFFPLCP